MTVVAVSRWKGDFQNIGVAREVAPLLKKRSPCRSLIARSAPMPARSLRC